jgi:hypothetical protein
VEGSCPLLWAGSIGGFFRSTTYAPQSENSEKNSSESGEYGHALGCVIAGADYK